MSLPPTDSCDYYALARHLNHNICFNFIFFFNVIEILEYKTTIKGLKSAEGYIRRQLAKNLNLRNTPEIRFILDESIEYGVNMSRLIDDVIEHDHSKGTESEDGEKQDTAETEDEE